VLRRKHDESDEMAKRAGDDMALPPLDFPNSSMGVCVKAKEGRAYVLRRFGNPGGPEILVVPLSRTGGSSFDGAVREIFGGIRQRGRASSRLRSNRIL
jgi:hypothetical protein